MAGKKPAKPFEGKLHVKKGDEVMIITGKDKGRTGKVIQVLPKTGKVVVEGLNIIIRHTKGQPTQKNPNPESGRLERPAPILASKVMLVGGDGQPTRVRIQADENGNKTRVAVKTGQPVQAG
jgi:large subunit ribosomal protein L24